MATKRTKEEWLKIFHDQKESGSNITQYCKAHQISVDAFFNARSRFSTKAKEQDLSFVPVSVDETSSYSLQFTFNDIKLSFDEDVSFSSLSKVLKVCRSL